jgi:hypothetical protein
VDHIHLPLGWMTVIEELLVVADVVVEGMTSDFEAAESINAVDNKLGGLVQPVSCWNNKFANKL